ncbi:chromate efflux transporter [Acinetobacter guerrae]|uniref:Chromate efflux transporter n=1 Tax=Acinetobacter guerrae TaxID=1843371 RepID=A0A3A8E9D6_9GAMM|nr:chromate efflux transporter [Acinetobacter guerrae]RKG30206.1 chromate efflux transporter [Acinetobacter guerrae]
MISNTYSFFTIFLIFLRLGLTSFGGPAAHLGYFREEFVIRRQWFSDSSYADLVALCQFLPGPASSQVGIAIGFYRSGYMGALAAWVGFTLPSAIVLILFAVGLTYYDNSQLAGVLEGLKIVAVAVVIQALWGMARSLCPDPPRITIMAFTACFVLLIPSIWGQVLAIIISGMIGLLVFKQNTVITHNSLPVSITTRAGWSWLAIFFSLLIGLPFLNVLFPNQIISLIDAFYRAGSLVFGGGHVVLPLLQSEIVSTGWLNNDTFLAGYSLAQAVPGPLFTFAAFLGASMEGSFSNWIIGLICLLAIFIPSFLLVFGILPFWERMRNNTHMRAALYSINAAVVGILLAALYQPIWTSSIYKSQNFCMALIALIALMFWKLPPWFVVLAGGILGGLITYI